MIISEAKKIHLIDYLQKNGLIPVKIKYGSAWFLSPFRKETTSSFKVDLNKNLWYDFGTGEGGNLIDLIMKLNNLNVPQALAQISSTSYDVGEHIAIPLDDSARIRINRIQSLRNPALIQYLKSRKVSLPFSRTFLQEAYYTVHGKQYFALSFANDRGGHELRNAFFKTGSSPKHFTTIQGTDNTGINVFEGFMDFLSCCTHYNRTPRFRTIVLNSLSFLPRIESEFSNTKTINLFLDNDQAGRTATQKIITTYNQVTDWGPLVYPNHKDFNDFIMN